MTENQEIDFTIDQIRHKKKNIGKKI